LQTDGTNLQYINEFITLFTYGLLHSCSTRSSEIIGVQIAALKLKQPNLG